MENNPYGVIDLKNKEIVLQSIKKTLEDLDDAVKEIEKWLETQKQFPEIPGRGLIEFYIVLLHFDMKLVKEKLLSYYSIRAELPEVFALSNPLLPSMKDTLEFTNVFPLPKLINDTEGCIFVKVKNSPIPPGFDSNSWVAATVNVMEIFCQHSVIADTNVIYDMENLSLTNILYITPTFILNCVKVLDKMMCNKIKIIHIINYPALFQLIMTMVKPILEKELYEKIRLHESIDSLSQHISLDVLPKDYGGKELSLDELSAAWMEKLSESIDRFTELENLNVDSLKNENANGLLSSFSKLFFK